MRGYVWKDERWPDYGISKNDGETEIPDELVERYHRVSAEYDAVQDELAKYYRR